MMLPHSFINNENPDALITGFLGDTVGGEPIVGIQPYKENFNEDDFLTNIFNRQIDIMADHQISDYCKRNVYNRIKEKQEEKAEELLTSLQKGGKLTTDDLLVLRNP